MTANAARAPLAAAIGFFAALLAGCAGADMPFAKDTSSTGATTPEAAANGEAAPGAARPADPTKLPFPTFGTTRAAPPEQPVLDAAGQAKMQEDLQRAAGQRESQMRQEIEQQQ